MRLAVAVLAGCGHGPSPASMDTGAANADGSAASSDSGPPGAMLADAALGEAGSSSGPAVDAALDGATTDDGSSTPLDAAVGVTSDGGETGPDCIQVAWGNPGKVEIAQVREVPAGAGKGQPFGHAPDLAAAGYEEHELFFTGTAPAFTSRMLVVRPSDPAKFSGTVYVEWFNVSGTMDVPVMWSASQEYFKREGHIYVGVSAQKSGADSLKNVDPERYADIDHPGDDAANAIFSRAGAVLRAQPALVLGECMVPRAVLAMGQSQSSMRLVDYLNGVAAADQVYDAVMTHSGGTPPQDPPVPTFVVRTMNEGNADSERPMVVEWDVAAASHNDKRLTEKSFEIIGKAYGFDQIPFTCSAPMNDYPAYRVYNAALDWMERWVRSGQRPPKGAPFEMAGTSYALDALGNMKGGVRLPDIDVPVKVYRRDNGPAAGADLFSSFIGILACGLAGTAEPLSSEQLHALYPTHQAYVDAYTQAADRALGLGFLLQADYDEMVAIARAAAVPE